MPIGGFRSHISDSVVYMWSYSRLLLQNNTECVNVCLHQERNLHLYPLLYAYRIICQVVFQWLHIDSPESAWKVLPKITKRPLPIDHPCIIHSPVRTVILLAYMQWALTDKSIAGHYFRRNTDMRIWIHKDYSITAHFPEFSGYEDLNLMLLLRRPPFLSPLVDKKKKQCRQNNKAEGVINYFFFEKLLSMPPTRVIQWLLGTNFTTTVATEHSLLDE